MRINAKVIILSSFPRDLHELAKMSSWYMAEDTDLLRSYLGLYTLGVSRTAFASRHSHAPNRVCKLVLPLAAHATCLELDVLFGEVLN